MEDGVKYKKHGRTGRNRRKHKLQACAAPMQCGQDSYIVALRKWMKLKAGFECDMSPAVFPNTGRGLMTKRKVRPGEGLVSLQHSLLITTQTVLNSDIGNIIKRWEPKLTPQQCLAIFLVWEKQKETASLWYNYIQVLPASFTTPAFFSRTELSFLPFSVRIKAQEECARIKSFYKQICKFCKTSWPCFTMCLTYNCFKWAWCVINTRSVFYEPKKSVYISDKEADNIALAPFLDLLNHLPTANIKAGFNEVTNCYEIVTLDSYEEYDQVFISYGSHGNHKLFMEYGFCVPDNPQDEFEFLYDDLLQACTSFKVTDQNKKIQVLRGNNLLQSLSCSIDGLSWKLWTALKTLAMNWDQLQNWNQIYNDEKAFESTVPLATAIAKHLLHKYLRENTSQMSFIQQKTSAVDNIEHVQIAKSLLSIERSILTTSLNKLG